LAIGQLETEGAGGQGKAVQDPKAGSLGGLQRVKANQGAAGVDGQSIAEFEASLSGNLYKLWNRLSSGSYFPPPVRRSISKGEWWDATVGHSDGG
jgi:hypothetical protein